MLRRVKYAEIKTTVEVCMRVLGENYAVRKALETHFEAFFGGDNHIHRLDGDCTASHVFWEGDGELEKETSVMPIKFLQEPKQAFFWNKHFYR
jgi:hypothetical protein